MGDVDYRMDHSGLGELLRRSDELRAACHLGADKLAAEAIARSPRGRSRPNHRHFQDSIHVEQGDSPKGDRVAAFVVADSDDALSVEFGTRRQAGHHVLGSLTD